MRRHDQHTLRLTPTQKRLLAIVASFDVPPTQRQISQRFARWAIRSPRFPRRQNGGDRG
jgi:hypothetical protein